MNKLSELKDYLSEIALFALFCRIVFLGAGIGDAIAVMALVASIAYNKWLIKSKVEDMDLLNKRMDDMSNLIQKLHMDKVTRSSNQNETKRKEIDPNARLF